MKDNIEFYFTVLDYIKGTDFMDMRAVPNYLRETFNLRKDEANNIYEKWSKYKGEKND